MLSIICETDFAEKTDLFHKTSSYENLKANKHIEIIHNNPIFKDFITQINSTELESSESTVETAFNNYFEAKKDIECERYELLSLAISCLQCFAQANWLGPLPEQTSYLPVHLQKDDPLDLSKKVFYLRDFFKNDEYELFQEKIRSILTVNGEYVLPTVKCVHLLFLAKIVFLNCSTHFEPIPFSSWWSLRLIFLYQQLFEERPQTLTTMSIELLDKLSKCFDDSKDVYLQSYDKEVLRYASIIFHLEASNSFYQNYNWTKAQESYTRALDISNISFELMGMYGKRTKYQQKDLAQLFLKVNDTNARTEHLGIENNFDQWPRFNKSLTKRSMPKDLALNDDTLLDKIKISNPEDEELLQKTGKHISQIEHMVLFGTLFDYQKNSPHTELTREELLPFIEHILQNSTNWSVQTCSMFMRTKLESTSNRRVERSVMQLETLLENFYNQFEDKATIEDRLQFFYTISFPPIWRLSKEMATFYKKLGLINSALEVYLRLQMWTEVIECYQVLDKKDQAETLIRERLAIKETAELYCSLGEVTNDIENFQKAIEFSKGKSAKAYRMLAKHQFARKQYEESITNFEKSLSINPMQYNAWFMLGSAAFRSDNWPTAVRAFRTCTHLEPDSHETWNNLAAAYIKQNEKNKAHGVFQEALKYDYDNVRVWENFLWTSTDCCYFEDVIRAYNRLLDIKEKYIDVEVLRALKISVEKKMKDPNEVSVFTYKQSILKLFGRLTAIVLNNWKIYWYYAECVLQFGMINEKDLTAIYLTPETAEKALSLYYKSFRIIYNQPSWYVSVESCDEIITVCIELLTRCIDYGKDVPTVMDVFGSLNLTVKSLISKLKQKYSVDDNNNEDGSSKYVKLLYLKDVNEKFVQLQQEHERFSLEFFKK